MKSTDSDKTSNRKHQLLAAQSKDLTNSINSTVEPKDVNHDNTVTMKQIQLSPALYQYILDTSIHEHPVLQALREETLKLSLHIMQTSPIQAQFMQWLLKLIRAKNVLELGTFTGYSALSMALALEEEGKVITCDINPQWTDIARPFWKKAGVSEKIDLKLAKALDTLHELHSQDQSFDFIFIDADKTNYVPYYELSLQLLAPNGILMVDNTLWSGKVIDKTIEDGQTREIKKLNRIIYEDKRVFASLLPIGDGVFLIQRRMT